MATVAMPTFVFVEMVLQWCSASMLDAIWAAMCLLQQKISQQARSGISKLCLDSLSGRQHSSQP